MELEDKQLEGRELDRELRLETERRADELPVVTEELVDVELEHRGALLDAMQLILGNEHLAVSQLGLPQREAHALEALQAAVGGRDPSLGTFVYAENRRRLLEQSLAVLQQNAVVDARFASLGECVEELRHALGQLEEAQEEVIGERREPIVRESADDKPENESLTDFLASALFALSELPHQSTLTGPPAEPAPPVASPELPEEPPTSTLSGPGPEATLVRQPSTLSGPELPDEPRPPSTLTGPERPEPPKPPSALVRDPP